jgi:hypothetical protein
VVRLKLREKACHAREFLFGTLLAVGLSVAVVGVSGTAYGTYTKPEVEVGTASTDSSAQYATGAEAYLGHFPVPEYLPDNKAPSYTALAWWVGLTLADGSFLQTGLATGGSFGCSSNYGAFIQAWRPDGSIATTWGGQSAGTCGTWDTTYRRFLIQSTIIQSGVPYTVYGWKFSTPYSGYSNNVVYESIIGTSGPNTPGVAMELTAQNNVIPSSADQMGPAGAYPATLTQHGIGNGYYATLSASAFYLNMSCPPPNVVGERQGYNPGYANRAGVGTGLTSYGCTSKGAQLWP